MFFFVKIISSVYFRVYYWSGTLRGFLHEGQFNLCVLLDTASTGSESCVFENIVALSQMKRVLRMQ